MLVDVWAFVATPGVVGGLMGNTCEVKPVTDAAQWKALFSRVEQPHLPQA